VKTVALSILFFSYSVVYIKQILPRVYDAFTMRVQRSRRTAVSAPAGTICNQAEQVKGDFLAQTVLGFREPLSFKH
jgi:hypothetical protein